ncbi:MAG: cell division protein FtsZ [Bacteroidales bacterium]|nr:cell division protein FtsZ [Bacteroidales bacterium]
MSETNNNIFIQFEETGALPTIIKVLGVGGGGSNAVNHMFKKGITGVDFVVCNTDLQSLSVSPVPTRMQIGKDLTEGRGAGNSPEVGRNAALENADDIRNLLSNGTKMVFITAGMGGGTGTGAAPVIAQIAKELDILTVGIVTTPFSFEGSRRKNQAEQGISEMKKYVDSLIIINNDKVRDHYGNLKLSEAFGKADDVLTVAAKGISELVTEVGYMNVDFEDVKAIMKNSGVAIMGTGFAEGEDRAKKAVEMALNSPLLNDDDVYGASNILLYMASGQDEISMDEVSEISEYIQEAAGSSAEVIWGTGTDMSLENKISVTVIATNFNKAKLSAENESNNAMVIPMQAEIGKQELPDLFNEEEEMKVIVKAQNEENNSNNSDIHSSSQTPVAPSEKITLHLDSDDENEKNSLNNFSVNDKSGSEPMSNATQDLFSEKNLEIKEFEQQPQQDPLINNLQTDRMASLKNFNFTNSAAHNFDEYEQPAFSRRGVCLSNENCSEDKVVSRFTLSEGNDKKPEIKENNTYLHDNVD